MKIRGVFYIVFFVLLLGLSGVAGCPKKDTTGDSGVGAFVGGSNGVDISFIDGEPPLEVLDNNQEPFYITLLIENMGEYIIPKGKIISSLSGINKDAFSLSSLDVKSKNDLNGITRVGTEILEGGIEELQFDQASYKSDLNADFNTQLRADVCYVYQTNSLMKLCLKKEPKRKSDDDLCAVTNEGVSVESSGSPLKISNVKSFAGIDKITFTFVISNAGSGEVYEKDAFYDKCVSDNEKKGKVNVKVKSQSELNIKCGILNNAASGAVRLAGGSKTVSCEVGTSGLQSIAFEEPFEIVLDYFYKEAIGRDLTILDSGY